MATPGVRAVAVSWAAAVLSSWLLAADAAGQGPAAAPEVGWNPGPPPVPATVIGGAEVRRTIEVRRTDDAAVDAAWLREQRIEAELVTGSSVVPIVLSGNHFEFSWRVPPGPAELSVRMRVRWKEGGTDHVREGPSRTVRVVPDVRVALPPFTDVGEVHSGCSAEAVCRQIDLSASTGLFAGLPLEFSRPDGPGWASLGVVLRRGSDRHNLRRGAAVMLAHDPERPVEVCIAPPRCADVPDPPVERIRVSPIVSGLGTEPRFAETSVTGAVHPNPWIECNLWWLLIVAAAILTVFIVNGIVRPHKFPSAAVLRVSMKERGLARDPGRPLYSVPHGRRGFYRSATCCFNPSGVTVGRSASHVLMIRAEGGSRLRMIPRGCPVERKERMAWKRVAEGSVAEWVESGVVYRVGQAFHFRIDM